MLDAVSILAWDTDKTSHEYCMRLLLLAFMRNASSILLRPSNRSHSDTDGVPR